MKHFQTFVFAAFLLISTPIFSQGGWQKIYPMVSGGPNGDGVEAVRQTPDGGYIIAGITEHNSGAHHNRIVKVNFEGTIQWDSTYTSVDNYSWATNIELVPGGGYYVEGRRTNPDTYNYEVYIQRLDANGNELWVSFYPQATYGGKGFVTQDGGYISCNYDYDNVSFLDSIALIKTSPSGSMDWVRKYSNAIGIPHSIIQTASGEYVVEGYKNNKAFLCKFDANGDSLWHQMYGTAVNHPEYIGKVVENADGSLVVIGNDALNFGEHDVYLFKTDAGGDLIWEKHYSQISAFGTDLDLTSDGGYILTGYNNHAATPQILLIKVDSEGTQEWLKVYNGDGVGQWKAYSVRQTTDGGYIVGGAKVASYYTRKNMYLIKTDELGEIYSNTLQGFVYADLNSDCIMDGGEHRFNNWLIEVQGDQTFWTSTDSDGFYWVRVATGDYQMIFHHSPNNPYWSNSGCTTDTIDISIVNEQTLIDTSYALTADVFCPLMTVSMSTPFLRRCFDNTYYINYCNNGTEEALDAHIYVNFDSYLIVDTDNIPVAWELIAPGVYKLNLGTVGVSECGVIPVNVYVSCDAELGQTHCSNAAIFPISNCLMPEWTGAVIEATAQCIEDSVSFTLLNVGESASSTLEYKIYQNNTIVLINTVSLDVEEFVQIAIPANAGDTYRIEAQQEVDYPSILGDSIVTVAIEGCGGSINTGFVTQYSNYDGSPFLDIDCQMNIGAYDPNDKNGFPVGYGDEHYIYAETNLEYKIRFQNTGTDTAFTVIIHDTISPFLDITTFQPGTSSHNYTWRIFGEGIHAVEFLFSDIMLPDSSVNEPGSNGFVTFSIRQKENNTVGTIIENTAGIFFDFNEPIITNTTFHEIGEDFVMISFLSIDENQMTTSSKVKVYPNPFVESTTIEIQDGENNTGKYSIVLYDALGNIVLEEFSNDKLFKIFKSSLSSGIYFYTVKNNLEVIDNGKVIIR